MGTAMGKAVKAVVGGLLGGGVKAPKVSPEPVADLEQKKKRKVPKAAYTAGGVAGQELTPGSVSGTDTLFGN